MTTVDDAVSDSAASVPLASSSDLSAFPVLWRPLLLLLPLLQALTSHFLQYQAKILAVKNVRDTIAVLHRVGRTVKPSCPRVRFV